jgi:hypothetical protein
MSSINNIYKSNLDIIINWNGIDLIKQKIIGDDNESSYILEIDGCYFNFFKNIIPNFNSIINIFYKSFNNYLILISIISNITNIDDNYNELNNNEYIANLINYLEQSLDGLYRFKEYYNKTPEYDKLEILYNNCCSQLELIKNNNIIYSFYETEKLEKEIENMKTYNNENDIFTEIDYEDIEFTNSSNNCRHILTYISNILLRITNTIYKYTGFNITFGD